MTKVRKEIIFIGLILLMFFSFTVCGCFKKTSIIEAEITNMDKYNMENASIQAVAWDPENDEDGPKASVAYDLNNNPVAIKFSSDFPILKIPSNGRFKYEIEKLEPGRYIFVVLQLVPKQKPVGYWGPGPYLARVIATKDNKPIVLDISENNNSSFSLDLGKVFISQKEDTFLVHVTFDGFSYVKP